MATTQLKAALVRLGDSGLKLTDPAEDIRGRTVLDQNGEEIGAVEDLYVDQDKKKVRFIQTGAGGFLGIGKEKLLIPVDAVTRVTDTSVQINKTREHVARGPRYNPELTRDDDFDKAYGYYGYPPFWTSGYVYPPYPWFY